MHYQIARGIIGLTLTLSICLVLSQAHAHGKAEPLVPTPASLQRDMVFPNTADYRVLTADLHTHTVFSDGHVWPNVRVAEGLRDGLDILAITEHLEWQPHRADLPNPDRNRAYAIAQEAATDEPILVVPGVEITRELPTGHINAIFVEDANSLVQLDAGADDAAEMAARLDALPDWGSERDVIEYYVRTGLWAADAAVSAANARVRFCSGITHPGRNRPPMANRRYHRSTSAGFRRSCYTASRWSTASRTRRNPFSLRLTMISR